MAEAPDGIVKTELNEPGLTLDYTTSGALDRFGRVTDHAWSDGTNDVVRIKHGYDRASNRLYREDPVARASTKEWDEFYTYDGVNQLIGLERGSLTATKDSILSQSKNFAEDWSLDMTGNWSTFKQDTNGDGTWDLNQSRTHNKANEITQIAGSSSNVAHDLNGNMTTIPQPADWSSNYSLTYDAWNRLVKVEDGQTTVATYAYDGRNHRVLKTVSSTDRHFYYNKNWQCLEERVDSSTTADIQHVWGNRYHDDLILRDRDTERLYSLADRNWNVVAVVDASGDTQERYLYSAYGDAGCFSASYASRSSSSCDWRLLYCGRPLDPATHLQYNRYRWHAPQVGRWLTTDPVGFDAEDTNLYRYTGNAPTQRTDPLGLWWTGHTVPSVSFPADADMTPGVLPTSLYKGEVTCPSGMSKRVLERVDKTHAWRKVASEKATIVGYYDGFWGDTAYLYQGTFTLQREIRHKYQRAVCYRIDIVPDPQACRYLRVETTTDEFREKGEIYWGTWRVTFTGDMYKGGTTVDPGDILAVVGMVITVGGLAFA